MKEKNKILGILEACRWAWASARHERAAICGSALIGILRVAAALASVWVSKVLVDVATGANTHNRLGLVSLSILLASLLIADMLMSLCSQRLTGKADASLRNGLRARIFSHLMHSRWIDSSRMHSGDVLNRLTEDVRQVAESLCYRLPQVVSMAAQFLGAFAFLCCLSWGLALCVAIVMPIAMLLSKSYVRRTRVLTAAMRACDSRIHALMQEGAHHHLAVQSMQAEDAMAHRVDSEQSVLYDKSMERLDFSVFSRAMAQSGMVACYLAAFLWSVWGLHADIITFGTMTAFLQLVARMQMPIVNMTHQLPAMVQALASVDRLVDIECLPQEPKDTPPAMGPGVGIRFDNVSFSYPGGAKDVFSGFSWDFAPGSKTALMGATGIGKSTLVKLAMAMLQPTSGSVSIYDSTGSVPASPAKRGLITYVPQGNTLIEGSIRDNMLLAKHDASDEEIDEALRLAVADFVMELPDGIDSLVGEQGARLSEGQAQRIGIARALLRHTPVMMLDEFNSSLDAATAQTLMDNLLRHRSHCTMIFISHRPEVASHCDSLLTL